MLPQGVVVVAAYATSIDSFLFSVVFMHDSLPAKGGLWLTSCCHQHLACLHAAICSAGGWKTTVTCSHQVVSSAVGGELGNRLGPLPVVFMAYSTRRSVELTAQHRCGLDNAGLVAGPTSAVAFGGSSCPILELLLAAVRAVVATDLPCSIDKPGLSTSQQ